MATTKKITKVEKKTKVATEVKAPKVAKKVSKYEIPVYSLKGIESETITLDKDIFGKEPNDELIAHYLHVYRTNQRQGTVSVKTRAEVIGTTKKVWKQKGTGRARHGSAKANLFVGGGVTFGPKPRVFETRLNKKQRLLALFTSLSQMYREKGMFGLSTTGISKTPKTSLIASLLSTLKLEGKKVMFIVAKREKNAFLLSARNIQGVTVEQSSTINTYLIMNNNVIFWVDNALSAFSEHFITSEQK